MLMVFLLVMLSTFRNASTQTEDGYEVDDMILSYEQVGWLQDGLLEGELDGVTAEDNLMDYGQANALIAPDKKWPNNRVYYSFAKLPKFKLSQIHQEKVRKVLKGLQQKLDSCITFEEKKTGSRIIVKSHRQKCTSHVGYMGKPKGQMLNLGVPLCFSEVKDEIIGEDQDGIIEHEFLHAIGIHHTHSRSDRNEYIKINNDNISHGKENFNSYNISTISHYGLPYDYGSVMHYPSTAFGIHGQITIETLNDSKQDVIGQRKGVSKGDIELVKRAYKCPSAAVNGGYTEWRTFDECSKACGEGEGTQTWYRTCTNPEPRHNKHFKGLTCEEQNLGPAKEARTCNGPCAVNGGYTQWSEFGECSQPCGDGTRTKYRTCINPQPQYNGLSCEEQNLGPDTETKACYLGSCGGVIYLARTCRCRRGMHYNRRRGRCTRCRRVSRRSGCGC